jgi:hypothetical protein
MVNPKLLEQERGCQIQLDRRRDWLHYGSQVHSDLFVAPVQHLDLPGIPLANIDRYYVSLA